MRTTPTFGIYRVKNDDLYFAVDGDYMVEEEQLRIIHNIVGGIVRDALDAFNTYTENYHRIYNPSTKLKLYLKIAAQHKQLKVVYR